MKIPNAAWALCVKNVLSGGSPIESIHANCPRDPLLRTQQWPCYKFPLIKLNSGVARPPISPPWVPVVCVINASYHYSTGYDDTSTHSLFSVVVVNGILSPASTKDIRQLWPRNLCRARATCLDWVSFKFNWVRTRPGPQRCQRGRSGADRGRSGAAQAQQTFVNWLNVTDFYF
jgi:hypothetical protein